MVAPQPLSHHKVIHLALLGHAKVNKISIKDLKAMWTFTRNGNAVMDWVTFFLRSC